jgi:DNA-directed RNA polymerase subunit beta'
MVLGLYYITKPRKSTKDFVVKGEGMKFYSPEEVIIAYNEGRVDLHAIINVMISNPNGDDPNHSELIETTVGRIIFNQVVPTAYGYVNELLTKKSLRDIIGLLIRKTGNDVAAKFLDDIKALGYKMAYDGGLSFNLGDVLVPEVKENPH